MRVLHKAEKGKRAGQWVTCPAKKRCRIGGTHATAQMLNTIAAEYSRTIGLKITRDQLPADALRLKQIKIGNTISWKLGGKLHNPNGPAVITPHKEVYYLYGKLHREDGPAIIDQDTGKVAYYKQGVIHREDGPALSYPNGHKEWWVKGILHREGAPAMEYPPEPGDPTTYGEYYHQGKIHRLDGPAVHHPRFNEYWVDGERVHSITPETFTLKGKKVKGYRVITELSDVEYWHNNKRVSYGEPPQ